MAEYVLTTAKGMAREIKSSVLSFPIRLGVRAENGALLAKLKDAVKSPERHPFVLEFHKSMGKLTAGAIYGGAGYLIAQYIGAEQVQALGQAARNVIANNGAP